MIKKILIGFVIIVGVLSIVLGVHIYIVTQPKPIDPNVIALTRVNYPSSLTPSQARLVKNFLYKNSMVDHVYIPEHGKCAVFSYYPGRGNVNNVIQVLNKVTSTEGVRYVPTKEEMMQGCPINQESVWMRAYSSLASLIK